MKKLRMVEFEDSDAMVFQEMRGFFNEMHSLFIPNRVRVIQFSELRKNWSARVPDWDKNLKAMGKLLSGNPLREVDLDKANDAIEEAIKNLENRIPDQFLPQELWERYRSNLKTMHDLVNKWWCILT